MYSTFERNITFSRLANHAILGQNCMAEIQVNQVNFINKVYSKLERQAILLLLLLLLVNNNLWR